jgi:glutathione S-transferase
MKLYTYDPAPNPQRLSHFMNYKGIEIDTQQVDMMAAEQLQDDYRAVNPDCTVPSLVLDDGTVLTEVIGMCTYLEDLHPDRPLLGTTPLERAQVISWDHKLFNLVMTGVAEALRNGTPAFENRALPGPLDVPQIPELVERGKLKLNYAWTMLDEKIGDSGWLAGDHFSLADIDLLICADFSNWVKSPPPESCTRLLAALDRIRQELG